MSERRNEVYSFGLFRLDAKEHVLLRAGKPIHLKPKIFELLVRLVENAGHMLTKEELMHLLWPDRFVDEHNLTVSIFHLRRALGATDEGYIQTMPKLGYRFTAKVRLVTTGSEDSSRQPGEILEGPIKSIAVLPLRSLGAVVD
jgi:DNA-binding winged helix-turn-helix (wHTH) protein